MIHQLHGRKKKNEVPASESRDNDRQEQKSCQHAETEESLNRMCSRNQVEICKSQRNWRGL